jgi:hypothetical protein
VKHLVSLQFLNLRHSIGLLGRMISPSQGRYLTKHRQTSMPQVGFEPTIPAFDRVKIIHALDRPYRSSRGLSLASHRGGPGSRPSSVWFLWRTKRHRGRFSPSISVSHANHFINFSIIIITRGWHNRPISGRSAEWSNWTPIPTIPIKKIP